VSATNAIDVELVDLSSSPNTIRIVAEGCQIVDPMNTLGISQQRVREAMYNPNVVPYWLTFDTGSRLTITANSTSELTMTVPSAGDFNAWALLARSSDDDGLTVEIYEGNRRRLQDGPIRLDQLCSVTGQTASLNAASVPLIFPFTHTFQRGTQITFSVVNTTGSDITLSMCWWGQLVYYPESPAGFSIRQAAPVRQAPSFIPVAPTLPGVQAMAGLRGWR
jgi:hypothetical protein